MDPACSGCCSSRNPSSSRPTMKSARILPVGVSSRERRACPWARDATSVVTRSWSQSCASFPVTRIFRSADRSTNARPASRAASCSGRRVEWTHRLGLSRRGRSSHPARHQRLPAARGRDPAHPRGAGQGTPARTGLGVLPRLGRGRCVRSIGALRGAPPARAVPVAHARRGAPGPGSRGGHRRRGRAVRRHLSLGHAGSRPRGPRHPLPRGRPWLRVLALGGAGLPRADALRHVEGLARARDVQRVHRAYGADRRAQTGTGLRAVPGGRRRGLPARSAHRRPPGAPRDRRPSAGGVREPSGGAEGAGRADPRDGAPSTTRAGRHPADRGRRAVRGSASASSPPRRPPTPSSSPDR